MGNKRGKRKRQDAIEKVQPTPAARRKGKGRTNALPTFDQAEYDALSQLCMYHPSQFPPEMWKYWKHRYQLFSMYDEGCLLDEQSWYSVTPECVAYRIARRCATDGIVLDLFAGAGGNAIQFAFTCARVVAVEIDPVKIRLARWNARVYGVEDRIHFVQADALEVIDALVRAKQSGVAQDDDDDDEERVWDTLTRKDVLAIDAIFLSPPWGGIDYIARPNFTTVTAKTTTPPGTQSETEVDAQTPLQQQQQAAAPPPPSQPISDETPFYSLTSIVPIPGADLFASCLRLTSNLAFYLPRNTDLHQLAHLAHLIPRQQDDCTVKVEEQWIGKAKLSSITAYYGQLASAWNDTLNDWHIPKPHAK